MIPKSWTNSSSRLKKWGSSTCGLIGMAGFIVGCGGFHITPMNATDQLLLSTLSTAGGGGGYQSFMMPESREYSKIPQDPSNPITDAKVELGKLLFHETGLSIHPLEPAGTRTYSCASCHFAQAGFQAGRHQGIAEGGVGFGSKGEARSIDPGYATADVDSQANRSPSSMNMAYQQVILYNGQFGANGPNAGTQSQWTAGTPKFKNFLGFDGLETQAIAAQGVHHLTINATMVNDLGLKAMFDKAFPDVDVSTRYSDVTGGLAIAAWERTVLANQAPFQRWMRGDRTALTESQKQGAILFFGNAGCVNCHNGPALNSMDFKGMGMKDLCDRSDVIKATLVSVENLGRGGFTGNSADDYHFKVPQLYNLLDSPFYGHGSSFTSVRDVVEYMNQGVPENPRVPLGQISGSFTALGLTSIQVDQITDFLEHGLYDANLRRYAPSRIKSGLAFPNNDTQSRIDLGY